MPAAITKRPAYRTLESWAIGTLIANGAIHECADHSYVRSSSDPEAVERALQDAAEHPFSGASPEKSVSVIEDILNSVSDSCPDCN